MTARQVLRGGFGGGSAVVNKAQARPNWHIFVYTQAPH
jgi:hypothetical protein